MWCSEFIARGIRGVYVGIYLSTAKIKGKTIPTGFALYYAGKSKKRKSNVLSFFKRYSGLENIDLRMHCGELRNLRNTKIKFTKYNQLFTELDYGQIKLRRVRVRLVFKYEYDKLRNKKR